MSNVDKYTVIKAKLFSDLLKHLDEVATSLMIQRDDMLEEMHKNNHDLYSASVEELIDMLEKNEELESDIRALLITEVDKLHEEVM
ncbi:MULTISPECIES: hypothetical protein [Bacillus cereus group]|uniref:hypothetical protein n=1 Tax=Bacillus cereus group TaxID=86661 RepID=UPI000BF8331D|nr:MULTISPECIES: hypothetical protein [Bacillus cereus group]MED1436912.1 hypothetical protein [Bacillus mycoides]MED1476994.1 hypothetical protein [Bacillus pseudomycoides]PGD26797.1 hypothetical protein COM32_12905 [Bacillus pseudomycoides]PGD75939.1 hypothetical protein COM46_13385 [Bacillus pseudomycoides]